MGQLDFEDFVAEVDRNDDEVDLGNPELDPETSWDFEIGTELRFKDQKGLINGRVFYRQVNDVSDQVPFGDFDSQPGNLASDDHYGFEVESSLRLAQFNLIDAVLGGRFLWQDSKVVDAFTGLPREFALQGDYEVSVTFRHDIKAWGLSYDIEYTDERPRIDKIVQTVVAGIILPPVYEAEFLGFSYGFRPGRGAHKALDALAVGIDKLMINWVDDCAIRKFFDTVSRDWLVRFLEYRITGYTRTS